MRRAAVYCDIRIAFHELMDIDGVAVIRIYILSDTLDKAGDIRRTAGAIEHLDALGYRQADFIAAPIFYPAVQKIYRQRIFIEEALSVERSAREKSVIDDPLHDIGRAEYVPITDDEAVNAFEFLSRTEGIIPAIESAHAVAYAMKLAPTMDKDKIIVVTVSGRGDKDCAAIARYRGENIYE